MTSKGVEFKRCSDAGFLTASFAILSARSFSLIPQYDGVYMAVILVPLSNHVVIVLHKCCVIPLAFVCCTIVVCCMSFCRDVIERAFSVDLVLFFFSTGKEVYDGKFVRDSCSG